MADESKLKSALMKCLQRGLPSWVHLRLEDVRESGHPDILSIGYGRAASLEVKHATPRFKSKGIQELTMLRLAVVSIAYYVVYWEDERGDNKRTFIVHPKRIGESLEGFEPRGSERVFNGHDHAAVVDWLGNLHA